MLTLRPQLRRDHPLYVMGMPARAADSRDGTGDIHKGA
jgi:hypothetical protein